MRSNVITFLYAVAKRRVAIGKKHRALNRPVRGCSLCGNPDDAFMLEDSVWAEAGMEKDELACLPCVSVQLGRELELSDFTVSLINAPLVYGYKLGQQSKAVYCAPNLRRPRSSPSGNWDVV